MRALRISAWAVAAAVGFFAACGRPAGRVASLAARGPDLAVIGEELDEARRTFDAPADAAAFFVQQRAPFGQPLPHRKYLEAERQIKAVLRARGEAGAAERQPADPKRGGSDGGIMGWEGVGPGHIGGRTRAIAVHPVNPDIMYIGGVTGGVWKSTNGGVSWTPLADFLPNIGISCIAMDPTDPETLYVGTGEGFYPVSTSTSEDLFLRGQGIFKTNDGGQTFEQLASTDITAFDWVNDIIVSPQDSQHVFAATWRGVYRSLDAGATWTRVERGLTTNTVGCTELEIRTDTTPPTLFAGFGSLQADGIYRSIDNGATWTELASGLPTSAQGRVTLAVAPSQQSTIYACIAQNYNGPDGIGALLGVYRSDDGGDTWTQRVDLAQPTGKYLLSNPLTCNQCINYDCYSQGWYDNAIVVDAANPDIVFVGGVDLQRSDDGGVTWGLVSAWWQYTYDGTPEGPNYCHADVHRLVLHPDYDSAGNQTLFVGSDGGVFRTDNARAATTTAACTWSPPSMVEFVSLNRGYDTIQFYHGDADAASGRLLGGSQDNGSFGLSPAAWQRVYGGDGGYCAIDYNNPNNLYVEIQYFPTIRKSSDGGQSFEIATMGINGDSGLFIAPFAMDPVDPLVLWTGGTRPWRTKNGAFSWVGVGADFSPGAYVSAIAIAPSDHRIVYLGFSDGYVYRTTNGLAANPTWTNISTGLRGGSGYVSWLAIDARNADRVFVTYSTFSGGKVYRTTTGGTSWTNITGSGATGIPDIPVDCVTIHPQAPDVLYAGSDLGLFVSHDGGATWTPDAAGLPHTIVETLDWQGPNRLVAFTHGRSVFLTDVCIFGPCDSNCDGSVNPFDIQAFLEDLADGGADTCSPCASDANGDGTVNPFDIQSLVACLGA